MEKYKITTVSADILEELNDEKSRIYGDKEYTDFEFDKEREEFSGFAEGHEVVFYLDEIESWELEE